MTTADEVPRDVLEHVVEGPPRWRVVAGAATVAAVGAAVTVAFGLAVLHGLAAVSVDVAASRTLSWGLAGTALAVQWTAGLRLGDAVATRLWFTPGERRLRELDDEADPS